MKANTDKGQILCMHCEEMIHPYATRCPYCSKDLIPGVGVTQGEGNSSFEQSLMQTNSLNSPFKIKEEKEFSDDKSANTPLITSQVFYVLLSLISLLAGSCFFFFGILIKFFSSNGVFTLEWNISSWPYFVVSAFICIALGLMAFSKIEK